MNDYAAINPRAVGRMLYRRANGWLPARDAEAPTAYLRMFKPGVVRHEVRIPLNPAAEGFAEEMEAVVEGIAEACGLSVDEVYTTLTTTPA